MARTMEGRARELNQFRACAAMRGGDEGSFILCFCLTTFQLSPPRYIHSLLLPAAITPEQCARARRDEVKRGELSRGSTSTRDD